MHVAVARFAHSLPACLPAFLPQGEGKGSMDEPSLQPEITIQASATMSHLVLADAMHIGAGWAPPESRPAATAAATTAEHWLRQRLCLQQRRWAGARR